MHSQIKTWSFLVSAGTKSRRVYNRVNGGFVLISLFLHGHCPCPPTKFSTFFLPLTCLHSNTCLSSFLSIFRHTWIQPVCPFLSNLHSVFVSITSLSWHHMCYQWRPEFFFLAVPIPEQVLLKICFRFKLRQNMCFDLSCQFLILMFSMQRTFCTCLLCRHLRVIWIVQPGSVHH